ncbi:MAG: 16S rRNA (cytosine(1402)-N(4))-methyltransferase RsmH [Candidatus Marinimicrobia bacterium]|nr:16S rRNA (cytosine(1402)-N(4))-methyltransferase RsmH [Candidatus Neomarinimicrobiota bacterium]MBT3825357.1 16S rRNA (cytosine(1402)-N(4))-methyltransferase RsmH [Candidatus Neomarinimicrobiota bacterium]MBT4296523.1 16S rRNA (cytosine(1402)-N(4))-methyltransferase RsmH [Candidatus Neomarinimicrobiota bacterium]MBT4993469.1 16S rRNA (cytosine(1402)-N(4))-methyltransferase RsmH [Candidatus Neomarinimicrobiota bacterium]MBT5314000.1 16S rRNA (cytosine(1402)-N(4))-methyltransferase RsmH [Candi
MINERSGVYIDGTFGLGGHSKAISLLLNVDATLIGIDQDESALAQFDPSLIKQTLHLRCTNFENLDQVLNDLKLTQVHGILLDLGLNSFSLDDPERGFAFSLDGPLDMRFDRSNDITAETVINEYSQEQLADIMYRFGEERNSRRIARKIVSMRTNKRLTQIDELREAVAGCVDPRFRNKSLARVFQAFRIEVNREMDVLETVLNTATQVLTPGGRLAVISYHSLEDRMVKNHFRDLSQDIPQQPGMLESEIRIPLFKRITGKPVVATSEEAAVNPRARSAKLRVAERTLHASD